MLSRPTSQRSTLWPTSSVPIFQFVFFFTLAFRHPCGGAGVSLYADRCNPNILFIGGNGLMSTRSRRALETVMQFTLVGASERVRLGTNPRARDTPGRRSP